MLPSTMMGSIVVAVDGASLLLKSATILQRARETVESHRLSIRGNQDDILCNLDGLDCAVLAVGGIHIQPRDPKLFSAP